MASEPSWGQSYDRNHARVSDLDSYFTSGTRTWIQEEGGDTGTETDPGTVSVTNGLHPSPVTDSKTSKANMTSSVSGDQSGTVSGNGSASRRDHISSIHDNPFYKSFGVRHPRSPRDVSLLPLSARHDTDSGLVLREQLGDYKPGSGFVNRLRGKFASLSVRDEVPLLPQPFQVKQASSLEDVNGDPGAKATETATISHDAEISPRERPRERISVSSYGAKHRAKSVDSLNHAHAHKQLHIPVTLRHIERKWERPSVPLKSPRETHIVAPDVTFARDDIILIENTPSHPPPVDDKSDNEDDDDTQLRFQAASFKEEVSTDELPKPNTVSTFRSFFESTSTDPLGKSAKPLSPTTLQSPFEQNSGDKENQDSSLTPRDQLQTLREHVTTPQEPILTPRDSCSSTPREPVTPRESVMTNEPARVLSPRVTDTSHKPFDFSRFETSRFDASKSRFSWTADVRAAGSSDVSGASVLTPGFSSASSIFTSTAAYTAEGKSEDMQSATETVTPSAFSVSGSTESNRPLVSPRSTAAVKAVPASRPTIPSRPLRPSSTSIPGAPVPPSFTPSLKKTSPVMPVAPFKDMADDGGENRYLIYAKKKSASKPQHATRVKDYGEAQADTTPEPVKKKAEENEKMEVEKEVEKTNRMNLAHTKGRAPPVPKQRTENSNPVDKREEVQFEPVSPRIDESVKPASLTESEAEPVVLESLKAPSAAPRNFFPRPKEEKEGTQIEESAPENSTEESQNDEPIRGIPSIIAQRLRQNQNAAGTGQSSESRPPGELFGVRLGKTRHTDSGDDGSEIPHKRLAAAQEAEKQEDASSGLPAEIENQIASVRSRMQAASKNKSPGVSKIFDSSQLAKKRKENQEARKRAQAVPRLDLTSITSDDAADLGAAGGYRVTPREIKPCNIEFIGGNIKLGRNMLEKNRKVKINIRFHDQLIKTFEYPSEESALEKYMQDHPNEVLVLEDESTASTESSDDPTDLLDTPREGGGGLEGELLKSNTSLSHSGSLQSYRGKFQQDYVLGTVVSEPVSSPEPVQMEQVDPESLQLRPADEDDTNTWSTSTNSDLLF